MILVIFDIDGTLTNTKVADDLCFIDSVRECWNIDLGEVDWTTYVNVTDAGLATDIYKNKFNKVISEKKYNQLKNLFTKKIISCGHENPDLFLEVKGAKSFIKELQYQEIKIAIATGGWKATAAYKLEKIGIELKKFPHATSDDHHERKMILGLSIEKTRELYQINFDQICYIGDGIWDYQASSELGIDFIGIDNLKTGKLKELGVKTIFQDFTNIELLIDKIRNNK